MDLELMGYQVSYYWNHPVGVGVPQHWVLKRSNANPKSVREKDNE